MRRLTVTFYDRKRAETQGKVTLGDCRYDNGNIRIFLDAIRWRVRCLLERAPHLSEETAFHEIAALVLLHELNHSLLGRRSRERSADTFALRAFRLLFGVRPSVGPWFRRLPSKKLGRKAGGKG